MLEKLMATLLKVILDKFWNLSVELFSDIALKRGIKITAEKNTKLVAEGDASLSNGELQGWLNALNKEQ